MAESISIKGQTELARKLKKLPGALEAAFKRAIEGEVDETVENLREDAPVKDGDLRDSIQGEVAKDGLTGVAAITARHAQFVVHGTSDTPANDFVTPVENDVRERFPERMIDEINAEIRKV